MATYGNLVDYEPGPAEGSYWFTDKAGQKKLFGGPAAENAARAIEKLKAQGPQPTAGGSVRAQVRQRDLASRKAPETVTDVPTPQPGAEGAGGSSGAAPTELIVGSPGGFGGQVSSFADAPPAAPAPAQKPPAATVPTEGAAPVPAQPPAPYDPRQPPPGFVPQFRTKDGVMGTMPDGSVVEWTAPRAGSPGGLVERSRTVKGGQEVPQEFFQREIDRSRALAESEVVGRSVAMERATAQRAFIEEQIRQQAEAMAENQRKQQEIQGRVQELTNRHKAATATYMSAPRSVERSDAEVVVNAIAGALGTFGASLTGSPNFALQIINDNTNQKIAEMERDIALKKEDADNTLAKLTGELGSLDLAKQSYAGLQLQLAKNEWERIALMSTDQAEQAEAQKQLAIISQAMDQNLLALQQMATGEVTRSIVNQPGSSGRSGGVRLPTVEEATQIAGLRGKEVGTEGAQLDVAAKARKLEGGLPESQAARSLLGQFNTLKRIQENLRANAAQGGQPYTPEGQWIGGRAWREIKDTIAGAGTYKEGLSPEEKLRSDQFSSNRQFLVGMGTQAAGMGAPSEGESMRNAAQNAQSEEQLINVISTYLPPLVEKLRAEGVSVPDVSDFLRKE